MVHYFSDQSRIVLGHFGRHSVLIQRDVLDRDQTFFQIVLKQVYIPKDGDDYNLLYPKDGFITCYLVNTCYKSFYNFF